MNTTFANITKTKLHTIPKFNFVEENVNLPLQGVSLNVYHNINLVPSNNLLLTSILRPYNLSTNKTKVEHRKSREMIFLAMSNFISVNQFIYYMNETYSYFRMYEHGIKTPFNVLEQDLTIQLLYPNEEILHPENNSVDVDRYFKISMNKDSIRVVSKSDAGFDFKTTITNIKEMDVTSVYFLKCLLRNIIFINTEIDDPLLVAELDKFLRRISHYFFTLSRSCETIDDYALLEGIILNILECEDQSELILKFSNRKKCDHFNSSAPRSKISISEMLENNGKLPPLSSGLILDDDLLEAIACQDETVNHDFSNVRETNDSFSVGVTNMETLKEQLNPSGNNPSQIPLDIQNEGLVTLSAIESSEWILENETEELPLKSIDIVLYERGDEILALVKNDRDGKHTSKITKPEIIFSKEFHNSLCILDVDVINFTVERHTFTVNVKDIETRVQLVGNENVSEIAYITQKGHKFSLTDVNNIFEYFI